MNAMQRFDAALQEVAGDGAIGGQHELFNEPVRDVSHAARDIGHALLFVEFNDRFREIEIDGAMLVAAGIEEQRQFFHFAEAGGQRGVALRHLSIAFKDFVDVRIGHAFGGANNAGSHARGFHVPGGVEFHERAHDQAILARLERTHAIRKGFRKHRDSAIGEVNGGSAETSLPVESALRSNIVRYIGDVDLQMPAAIRATFDVDGVVEIARGLSIDGHDRQVPEIFPACALDFIDGLRATLGFIQNFGGERMREMMLADDDLGINAEIAGTPENLDDAAGRRCASVRIAQQLHVHDGSVQFIQPRDAPRSDAGFIRAAETQLLPQPGGQFVAARNLHLVLDSNIVRQDHIVLGAVAKQTDDRWMRAAQDSNDAALSTLRAGDAAQTLNLCQNVVAVHRVLDAVARNEDIAVELRHRRIRDDEAITVVVENQPSFYFIAIRERRGLWTPHCLLARFLAGRLLFRLAAREAVPSAGQFLDGAAFPEL